MNCSIVGHSCRLQVLKNCSNVGPFHRVQSVRNRLLWHRSPASHSCCQEPAPVCAFYALQVPSGHIHVFHCGVPLSIGCGYPLQCGHPQDTGEQSASLRYSSQAAGKSLITSEHLLPFLFTSHDVCIVISFTFLSLLQLLPSVFYHFLKTLSQRCHQCCCHPGAVPCNGMVLTLFGTGCLHHRAALGLFSQRSPLQSSLAAKTLPHKPSKAISGFHRNFQIK